MDSLRYPLSGESSARTVAVGAMLSSLGLLILPAVVVTGYYGRVLVRSSRGADAPGFEDFGDLFADGLRTWLTLGAFAVVAAGLFVGFGAVALALGAAKTELGAGVGALVLAILVLPILSLFASPACYFAPAALTRVSREQSVAAAFDLRAVWAVVFDRRYFGAWLAGCGLLAVGSVGYGGLLSVDFGVPLASHVLGAAVNFYCGTVAFHCFGRGYAAATGDEAGSEDAVADEDGMNSGDAVVSGDAVAGEDAVAEVNDGERALDRDAPRADSTGRDVLRADSTDSDTADRPDEWGADAERWRENRRAERE
ncbi:DUF4013 domain-containing protein [Halorussus aquaticus]|uniref:DUF4013 domain-containing protein n=1 Tax=Halorussus aquaticus TaxID=2953748 RepID=A0ABD5Q402_9EURY|nr:DUF4013 domain-containing protein [Halorussus aquaticus]